MKKLTFLAAALVLALASTAAAAATLWLRYDGWLRLRYDGCLRSWDDERIRSPLGLRLWSRHDVRLRGPLPALLALSVIIAVTTTTTAME